MRQCLIDQVFKQILDAVSDDDINQEATKKKMSDASARSKYSADCADRKLNTVAAPKSWFYLNIANAGGVQ